MNDTDGDLLRVGVLTKYGLDVIWRVIFLIALLNGGVWFLTSAPVLRAIIGVVTGILLLFTLYFFRDPERTAPPGQNLALSPADGKVVLIKNVRENEYLQQDAIQISIFLSPLNVHVNRFPISGKIEYFKYVPGKYLVAFDDKASDANERTHIGIMHESTKVLFKQIAGFIARRIVADVQIGMEAVAGERFGMIKFGSRVDVLIPASSEVRVKLDDNVVAGETVVAVLR